jgi:hypothetical protein
MGPEVLDEDEVRLLPARFEHTNLYEKSCLPQPRNPTPGSARFLPENLLEDQYCC